MTIGPVRPGVRLPLAGFARALTGNGPNEKSHVAMATAGRIIAFARHPSV